MTPHEFREKWSGHELKERSAYQEHFIDLCRVLGHPTPAEADPKGESFCFEYGVEKLSGSPRAGKYLPSRVRSEAGSFRRSRIMTVC